MTTAEVRIGSVTIGGGAPLALIGGPCAIESERHALMTAERLASIAAERKVPFIYKSSYDKANRSSIKSYRGPGLTEGLRILKKVRDTLGCPSSPTSTRCPRSSPRPRSSTSSRFRHFFAGKPISWSPRGGPASPST
jgi:3-deoxy-D-arabino-heptulosonate 7-phosphate (DAHP) synthase